MICLASQHVFYVFLSKWSGRCWRPAAARKFHLLQSSWPPPAGQSNTSSLRWRRQHLMGMNFSLVLRYLIGSFLNVGHGHQGEVSIPVSIYINGHLTGDPCPPWWKQWEDQLLMTMWRISASSRLVVRNKAFLHFAQSHPLFTRHDITIRSNHLRLPTATEQPTSISHWIHEYTFLTWTGT